MAVDSVGGGAPSTGTVACASPGANSAGTVASNPYGTAGSVANNIPALDGFADVVANADISKASKGFGVGGKLDIC